MSERIPDSRWRHDLKNQLGIVLGFSELLLEDLQEQGQMRADLEEILRAGRKAMALVDEIEETA
jgi:signal transduction histidine kinase